MARWAVLVAIGFTLLGCGHSLRRSQQSRVYFERCYSADFDPRVALGDKHACWSAWLAHYTSGQPEDRSDYARGRLYAIEHGESVPRLPGLPAAALGPRSVTPVTAAATTEGETAEDLPSPLPMEEPAPRRQRPRRQRHAPPLPRTSNPSCAATACEGAWRTCHEACDEVAACETACEIELLACARGCF
jgi:hypothetical protein